MELEKRMKRLLRNMGVPARATELLLKEHTHFLS